MIDDELRFALQPIIERFGMEAVQKALREFPRHDRMPEPRSRSGGGSTLRKAGGRRNLNAVEYVKKMDLSEERADVIGRAAREFERRTFLPTRGDIKSFCETYGVDEPKSTSRTAGIPRIFKFLKEMEAADIETILDDRWFSGPAELGPIAEAIRGRARQQRDALAESGRGTEWRSRHDDPDPGVPVEVWNAAKAEAREVMKGVARRGGTMSYSQLVAQMDSLDIEPHDSRLARLLGQIAEEEDEAGRGLLTVLVVHQGGDRRPGAGFFEMASTRGRDTSDRERCWLEELQFVHGCWAESSRGEEVSSTNSKSDGP